MIPHNTMSTKTLSILFRHFRQEFDDMKRALETMLNVCEKTFRDLEVELDIDRTKSSDVEAQKTEISKPVENADHLEAENRVSASETNVSVLVSSSRFLGHLV